MNTIVVLQGFAKAATHYGLSNKLLAMQKDGREQFSIGILAGTRMDLIRDSKLSFVPPIMGLLAAGNVRILGKASHLILQHADALLNGALLIHSIALIALGFPLSGAIALFGLSLIALKRCQRLPTGFDHYMGPIILLGQLATTLAAPMSSIWRTIGIVTTTKEIASRLLNTSTVRAHLPNPFHNKHVIRYTSFGESLSVNPTHVYADEVGELLPADAEMPSAEELFKKLDHLELTEIERIGLSNIRECAITGRTADRQPSDMELFKKVIRALVQAIINDKENFEAKTRELASVGNHCVEGWTRDINAMLTPQTTRVRWVVHHILAKMRGAIVQEEVRKYNLDLIGGSNSIHTLNDIQSALWHKFRTFEGELGRQLRPLSALDSLYLRTIILNDKSSFIGNFLKWWYTFPLFQIFEPQVKAAFMNPDTIVDSIYDAIKPEYLIASDGRAEARRTITWEAVQTWMADIDKRRDIDASDRIEQDIANSPYLSKAGVRLLLWDIGVLESAGDPKEEIV